jgi:hypothetical protein
MATLLPLKASDEPSAPIAGDMGGAVAEASGAPVLGAPGVGMATLGAP